MPTKTLTLPTVDLEALRWLALRQALAETNGNQRQAADRMGIHRRTVQKLKRQLRPQGELPFYVTRCLDHDSGDTA